MKSVCQLSGLVSFAALLCFLPSAFGQNTVNIKATPVHSVLAVQPSIFLALALTSGEDLYWDKHDKCESSEDNKGGKCMAVPEGGTPLMYLLLAGFACLGAMALRSRRRASMRQTT